MSDFSVTGSILSGSEHRPDILTTVRMVGATMGNFEYPHGDSAVCSLNKYGYIPGISTITGLSRTLLGVIHTIVHFVCSIFSSGKHHSEETNLGLINIARGMVEAVPLIGNFIIMWIDGARIQEFTEKAKEIFVQNQGTGLCKDKVVLFAFGTIIASLTFNEYRQKGMLYGEHELGYSDYTKAFSLNSMIKSE